MKIRINYVSNSSSSSFCILGLVVPNEAKFDYRSGFLTIEEGIYDYRGDFVIGAIPQQMKDDETLLEFKLRIVEEMKKYGIEVNVDELKWIKDGGYDG